MLNLTFFVSPEMCRKQVYMLTKKKSFEWRQWAYSYRYQFCLNAIVLFIPLRASSLSQPTHYWLIVVLHSPLWQRPKKPEIESNVLFFNHTNFWSTEFHFRMVIFTSELRFLSVKYAYFMPRFSPNLLSVSYLGACSCARMCECVLCVYHWHCW